MIGWKSMKLIVGSNLRTMAKYSQKSLDKLKTAHYDLILLFTHVIKEWDNTILFGNRSQYVQFELYKKGRDFVEGQWVVVDKSKVVTNCDGHIKLSEHNHSPSHAVDAVAYPIDWGNTGRNYFFAGYVLGVAARLYKEGLMGHRVICGADWDGDGDVDDQTLRDVFHFQIVT